MNTGDTRYEIERALLPRGTEILLAYKNTFAFPSGYLVFAESGEHDTTRMRADIIEIYTPAGNRGDGAATALVRHLQTLVHAIHTVSCTAGASVVLHRCGFTYNEASMDWSWDSTFVLPDQFQEGTE